MGLGKQGRRTSRLFGRSGQIWMITMNEHQGRSDARMGRYLQCPQYCPPPKLKERIRYPRAPASYPEGFRGDRLLGTDGLL